MGLETKGLGNYRWRMSVVCIVILLLYAGIVFFAGSTGHWQGNLSDHDFSVHLRSIHLPEIRHPEFHSQRGIMK
ncbi:MAG: hypothetical protein C0403_10975 [Desulfobacterium sp.]|nr:hypothetical protein [Desulfobacterium sp.]